MIILDKRHLLSLDRAIVILRLKARNQPIPRFRREWERDIRNLRLMHKYIKHDINQPILPMFDNLTDAVREVD